MLVPGASMYVLLTEHRYRAVDIPQSQDFQQQDHVAHCLRQTSNNMEKHSFP